MSTLRRLFVFISTHLLSRAASIARTAVRRSCARSSEHGELRDAVLRYSALRLRCVELPPHR